VILNLQINGDFFSYQQNLCKLGLLHLKIFFIYLLNDAGTMSIEKTFYDKTIEFYLIEVICFLENHTKCKILLYTYKST